MKVNFVFKRVVEKEIYVHVCKHFYSTFWHVALKKFTIPVAEKSLQEVNG
jgi:hypothetical protein